MGLFDLPAPLFAVLDAGLAHLLSPTLRLVVWGLIGAGVSMGLYWLLSPQRRIAETKIEAAAARRRLDAFDGEFAAALPLIGATLRPAFRQLGLVVGPAVAASLPLLALLAWLSTAYGHAFPAAPATVGVHTVPNGFDARLEPGSDAGAAPAVVVRDEAGEVVERVPLQAPVATIHKREWWNFLIGNPAGYLPEDAALERIELALPEREYLAFGPAWLRAWYVVFFAALLIGSLLIKVLARIE